MPILRMSQIREMSREDQEKRLEEFRTELSKVKTMINAKDHFGISLCCDQTSK